ncbi:hypothetical protein KUV47_02740 [Vannielia litorea]|uniref:hypothetical protein n=1 Tax=Vannielia litorea TaxID=1217970 RepID=UPI001C950509|nr:hypothetical protein [Vannielia litorea]MBY6152119.1 hypothetical protein [Vannielia litorea]
MIEQYFRKGICLDWHKPTNVDAARDGQIHHRIRHSSPLIYDGLAADPGAWDAAFNHTPPSAIGLTSRMNIHHKWLDYRPGATARCHRGHNDVLTGFMSGCLIVTWTDATGDQWVGHVGTVESEPPNGPTNTLVKTTARGAMTANADGFNPAAAWTPMELGNLCAAAAVNMPLGAIGGAPHIMALVTSGGVFYSIALMLHAQNKYVVLGSKQVPGMGNGALLAALN